VKPRVTRLFAALLCALLLSGAAAHAAQRRRARAGRFTTEFGAEDRMTRALKIPDYVFEQMIRSERDAGRDVSDGGAARIREEVRGALVDLNDDGRADLLVRSDQGANVVGFWLFRNAGRRWEMVLYSVALNLIIKKRRTRGHRDVEAVSLSAVKGWVTDYEFDGARYRPASCWERDLGVGKGGLWGRARRVRCGEGGATP
jgi:hypothetical protein